MEDVRNRFNTSSKSSKSKKKNPLKFIIPAVAVVALMIVGSLFMMNNKDVPQSVAVSSVSELTEPIEFKVNENIPEADYKKIVSRLEAYGVEYYTNKDEQVFAVAKNDLGTSNQEILATLHMILGKGEVKIDSQNGSSNALLKADIEKCEYILSEEEKCSYMNVYANETGEGKLAKLEEEIVAEAQDYFLNIFVDGNLRCNDAVFDEEKIIIEGGYDGKQLLASNLFGITAHAAQAEGAIELSPNYIRLLVSIVNDGELTKSYEVYIDEKYGIVLPEEIEEPEITEEPEQTEETVVEDKPATTKPSTPTKKPTTQTKPSTQTQQKPVQQQPAQQQQPVQQQPVQQQPVQQQPVQQQPVQQPQQTTPPASNPAGMPEVYIDFD